MVVVSKLMVPMLLMIGGGILVVVGLVSHVVVWRELYGDDIMGDRDSWLPSSLGHYMFYWDALWEFEHDYKWLHLLGLAGTWIGGAMVFLGYTGRV